MTGTSLPMLNMVGRIKSLAPHYRTLVIVGETGTGKNLAAHAIHNFSPVARGPWIEYDCASFSNKLFEIELFGYVRGAFSGALRDRVGLIAAADKGTLFLDEIGELPLVAQAKLVRALQTREVRPVGATWSKQVDIRVVAATKCDLRSMVVNKTFREDLYYHLSMLDLKVPPLRDRREDIPLLANTFVEAFSKQFNKTEQNISARAMQALCNYHWPGNVRELENTIGSAVLMSNDGMIELEHLPAHQLGSQNSTVQNSEGTSGNCLLSLAEVTRRHIQIVLEEVGGSKTQAAHALKISRATLYRYLNDSG